MTSASYERQVWGDLDPTTPLSSDRLNHIEAGIDNATLKAEQALDAIGTGGGSGGGGEFNGVLTYEQAAPGSVFFINVPPGEAVGHRPSTRADITFIVRGSLTAPPAGLPYFLPNDGWIKP